MLYKFLFLISVLVLNTTAIAAQQLQTPSPVPVKSEPSPTPETSKERGVLGHIHINELQTIIRYNYQDRGHGDIADRDVQYRIRLKAQIDLAPSGNTFLKLRAETGKGFANSFDNTGIGHGHRAWHFNVKTIALGQKFGSHVSGELGGLEFDSGAGSQITYASGDGYLVGYRLVYSSAALNKLSATVGFIGDFDQLSVFKRLHLGRVNYVQILGLQNFSRHIEASAQFDSIRDIQFTREAFQWKKMPGHVFDDAMLELVERLTDHARFGWSLSVGRSVDKDERWRMKLIYSDIPFSLYRKNGIQILQNQGEIDKGKRFSGGLSRKIGKDWEARIFAGRRIDSTPGKRWVAQIYLSYDFARVLNRVLQGSSVVSK